MPSTFLFLLSSLVKEQTAQKKPFLNHKNTPHSKSLNLNPKKAKTHCVYGKFLKQKQERNKSSQKENALVTIAI
ncbi:hypothetical protein AT248_02550 [Bartonella henselae]|nr:hypothetical protein AT244_05765 [Bartonella henselae]OLL41374.1 hypothetical protein AT237_05785 [Bartonella henselae]OLL46381.1 hypothetical protein AT245_07250 [Bartonella henselae]OLL48336.1 hypothetical protein AT242_03685 [Bartonella henselae]OLL51906.1 hypothetical protein AT238_02760 [Bartonella henselae]